MRRYKKYKKYGRRRSTNVIKMKFQSFLDISTSDSSMQIITISAGGPEILKRLSPMFAAYKYYKIGGISVKLLPASTLPCDPTGLSYEAGENTVDPRDQLTPGLMRITNGEDIFEDISGLSDDQQHGIFNNMLLDPRWYKWMLQSGVKRFATPRYWQIGQLHQDKWPGAIVNVPKFGNGASAGTIVDTVHYIQSGGQTSQQSQYGSSSPYGFFQTGHRGVLGWLPTDGLQIRRPDQSTGTIDHQPFIASPPEVECMKIILPKAYKTRYFYRAYITETVYFREPIVNFGIQDASGNSYRPLDIFHHVGGMYPANPGTAVNPDAFVTDAYTGGNYGDN